MPFYAHPTGYLSPGDVFPAIPFTTQIAPIKIARSAGYNPPAGRGPADFRRIYTLPDDAEHCSNNRIETPEGEETLASTRVSKAIFLTWGSQVESTERRIAAPNGRIGKQGWLAAPVYNLNDIPAGSATEDPETHERVPLRDLIRQGRARDNFYLPPFPNNPEEHDHYVELRKITYIGVQFFRAAQPERIVTLTMETLNELYSHLLWSLTRAELFFRPVVCECGRPVKIDTRFHGQNFDAEPWL
jgi:hypothetical protein